MRRYPTYLKENERFNVNLSEVTTVLVKYRIGRGGFGEVWRASHPGKPREYALKHINIPRLIAEEKLKRADKQILIERIRREASIRVESPYVVTCYGYREIRDNFFLLSDFVAGDPLNEWIWGRLEMPWETKKPLFLRIVQGVRDLHRAGIIHRDLKPSNILVEPVLLRPTIIDFGLARLDESTLTASGDFSGSGVYKDPSLIKGMKGIKAGDRASDVYALGVLLYEIIMGQNPWKANGLRYEEIFEQIQDKDNVLDLDRQFRLKGASAAERAAVEAVIRLSTRFDRAQRLQTVDDILARLGGEAEPSPGSEWVEPATGMEFVWIPGGCFMMGSPKSEKDRYDDEGPVHEVCLDGFWLGKYEVTQAEWEAVMGKNPSWFNRKKIGKDASRHPVEAVSWEDAQEFLRQISQRSGQTFRLPSEAEWEYACRAGTQTPFSFGETISTDQANYDGEYVYGSGKQTTPVGSFPPNAFGLYDMHGNVYEWCQDDEHDSYEGAPADGSAWVENSKNKRLLKKLLRGGSWIDNPRFCRCASRNRSDLVFRNSLRGFRVVVVLVERAV